jgi:hypothetical protein
MKQLERRDKPAWRKRTASQSELDRSPVQVRELVDITQQKDGATVLQPFDLPGNATVARDHHVWILVYARAKSSVAFLIQIRFVRQRELDPAAPLVGRPNGENKGDRYTIYGTDPKGIEATGRRL